MFRHHICPRCRRQYLAEVSGCPHCGTTRAQRFAAGLRDITRRLTAPTGAPHTPGQRIDPAGATDAEGPRATDAPGPITACRHCQRPVSRAAKTCPHCGVDSPTQTAWERATTALFKPSTLIALAVVYLFITWSLPTPPPTAEQVAQAARDEAACRDDAKCWGNRHIGGATFACKRGAERQARHAVRWPEGFLVFEFPAWRWHNKTDGTLLFFGQADLQNGFGAWTPYQIACIYDPAIDKAIEVHLAEGRL